MRLRTTVRRDHRIQQVQCSLLLLPMDLVPDRQLVPARPHTPCHGKKLSLGQDHDGRHNVKVSGQCQHTGNRLLITAPLAASNIR